MQESALFSPQPKGIGDVACTTMRRRLIELLDGASPSIVSSGCRDEACRNVGDVPPPFLLAALLAAAFESSPTDVVLIGALLTRQ